MKYSLMNQQRQKNDTTGLRKKHLIFLLIALIVFLPLIPYIRYSTGAIMECIFCKIVGGRVPETKIELETDEIVIFRDIKPASTHHYLAVSKRHIESLKSLTKSDEQLVLNMEKGLKDLFKEKGIDADDALFGFHVPPYISVRHLHLHGISPRSTMTFINRFMFRPGAWFKTVDNALKYLQEKD